MVSDVNDIYTIMIHITHTKLILGHK